MTTMFSRGTSGSGRRLEGGQDGVVPRSPGTTAPPGRISGLHRRTGRGPRHQGQRRQPVPVAIAGASFPGTWPAVAVRLGMPDHILYDTGELGRPEGQAADLVVGDHVDQEPAAEHQRGWPRLIFRHQHLVVAAEHVRQVRRNGLRCRR